MAGWSWTELLKILFIRSDWLGIFQPGEYRELALVPQKRQSDCFRSLQSWRLWIACRWLNLFAINHLGIRRYCAVFFRKWPVAGSSLWRSLRMFNYLDMLTCTWNMWDRGTWHSMCAQRWSVGLYGLEEQFEFACWIKTYQFRYSRTPGCEVA